MIFTFPATPGTVVTGSPRASTIDASSVTSTRHRGMGLAQEIGPEPLRGLHDERVRAVQGANDDTAADLFEGIGNGHHGDDGVRSDETLDDEAHQVGAQQRPSRVMDQDIFDILGDLSEPGGDGVLPAGSADDTVFDISNDDHVLNPTLEQGIATPRPQRTPCQFDEMLGAAEAGTRSGGHEHRPRSHDVGRANAIRPTLVRSMLAISTSSV